VARKQQHVAAAKSPTATVLGSMAEQQLEQPARASQPWEKTGFAFGGERGRVVGRRRALLSIDWPLFCPLSLSLC
jgi:hypothetical protein